MNSLANFFKPQTLMTGLKTVARVAENNAPAIAAGFAVAGMVAAVIATVKAGPSVQQALEEAHIKKNEKALAERMDAEHFSDERPIEELTWKEKAPIYLKGYLKAIILMLLSASCMIGSVYFGNKQKAALTVLLTAAESKIVDLEEATKSIVGDKKFDQIKGAIIDKKVADYPPIDGAVADTGMGKSLCLEPVLGRYYWSDIDAVKNAYADFRLMYANSGQVYLEDLYHLLKIPAQFIPKYAGELMFMYDETEGISYPPEVVPRTIPEPVRLNGVDYNCFTMDFAKYPKTYNELLAEVQAKRQFQSWR